MLSVGQLVDGKYRVGELLGAGGMGAVYEATVEATGQRIALKVVLVEHAKDRTQHARFQREARAAGAIDSQHIARLVDAGVDDATGMPFIAMERLEGEDVQKLLRRIGPLPPELALRVCAQACIGLAKAHDSDVIHRDIKSANVFVARSGDAMIVKLLDFGVAKVRKDPSQLDRSKSLTQTGGLLGSPLYMSPEQAIGAKTFDARTDVFSLGVVLYEMLTGRVPHEEHETIGRLIIAICQEPAPHVQDLAPWVPGPIAWIVHKALEIDPGDRYPTALAMLDAIIEALPEGWEIEPSTVTSLSKAEIQTTAPRLELPHARSGTGRSALAATIPIDPSDVPRAAGADRSEGGRDTTVRTRPRARLVTFLSAGLFVALAIAVVIVAAKTAPRPIETRAAIDPKPADSAAVSPPPGASAQPPAPAARPDTSTVAARDDKAGGRPAAPRKQGSLTPAPAPTSGTPSPSPAASTAPAASRKLGTSDSFE